MILITAVFTAGPGSVLFHVEEKTKPKCKLAPMAIMKTPSCSVVEQQSPQQSIFHRWTVPKKQFMPIFSCIPAREKKHREKGSSPQILHPSRCFASVVLGFSIMCVAFV